MFPTDYCVGDGETVFINVEYLPSEVGVHEACFIMVQVPIVVVVVVVLGVLRRARHSLQVPHAPNARRKYIVQLHNTFVLMRYPQASAAAFVNASEKSTGIMGASCYLLSTPQPAVSDFSYTRQIPRPQTPIGQLRGKRFAS